MKIKLFILGLSLGIAILSGCNDDLTQVGIGTMPETDGVTVQADTFFMKARTLQTDSVYARTRRGTLGEIYDPLYGNLKSDYICQFYCPENYKFRFKPIDGKIDSIDFKIFYSSWTGDSLTPMRVQLYQISKPLPRDFYTNIDPTLYANLQTTFGSQTYTSFDTSVPDSIRYAKNSDGTYTYQPRVTIRMSKELGQKFYDETQNNPSSFKDQNAFNQFFPGIYVTNTYGTGNILDVEASEMGIYYKYVGKTKADANGNTRDTVMVAVERFSVTDEVIQLNRFKNTDMSHLLEPNDSIAYLKSPAGVYTQLTIPSQDIAPLIKDRILSNMELKLKALPQEDWKYAFEAPEAILILPSDSVDTFFKKNQIENNFTSFVGKYATSTRTYAFGNISNMLKNHMEKAPDKDLVISVIPIKQNTTDTRNYYGQTTTYTVSVNNYMKPSGVKLRIDKEAMQMRVVSIKYK